MAQLSNSSLIFLTITILIYLLYRYGINPSTYFLLLITIVLIIVSIITIILKRLVDKKQFLPILLGFVGSIVLNNLLSASHLANYTTWLIQTNTGAFNYDFHDNLFILCIIVFAIIIIVASLPSKNFSQIERTILVLFGLWVGSLILAGINFTSLLNDYLLLLPVATHWGDQLRINPAIIVDVLKSLFLAALFNVLERIARMRQESQVSYSKPSMS